MGTNKTYIFYQLVILMYISNFYCYSQTSDSTRAYYKNDISIGINQFPIQNYANKLSYTGRLGGTNSSAALLNFVYMIGYSRHFQKNFNIRITLNHNNVKQTQLINNDTSFIHKKIHKDWH